MKKVEYIKQLLEKYFEGETSHSDELELRRYFATTKELPEEWAAYKPLFGYIDEESGAVKPVRHIRRLYLRYIWTAAAACILLLLGVAGYNGMHKDYVIIDGQKSTDVRLARQQAEKAFADVSFSQDDIKEDLVPQEMKEIVQ
jgi:hypothetical protein